MSLYSSQHVGAAGAPGAVPASGAAGAGGSLIQDSARPPEPLPLPSAAALHEGGSEADFAALSDFEDDGDEDEDDEDLEEEEDEDEEDGTHDDNGAIVHGDGQPYPGFVPVALKYLDQNTRPRSWCLAMITNPYPLLQQSGGKLFCLEFFFLLMAIIFRTNCSFRACFVSQSSCISLKEGEKGGGDSS